MIQPNAAFGGGYRAYPYYGYGAGYGWDAGSPYYDMPYGEQEVSELDEFEYERFEQGSARPHDCGLAPNGAGQFIVIPAARAPDSRRGFPSRSLCDSLP